LTTYAWALLVVALVVSAVDWLAVATQRRGLEYVYKPAAALAFLATAIALDPGSGSVRAWFCVALGACVVGDVFLMLPNDAFVAGLSAFIVAQVCFTVGFVVEGISSSRLAVGIVVVAALGVPLAVRFVHALRTAGAHRLVPPVTAYMIVISAMVASAIGAGAPFRHGAGNAWGIAGAALFFCSDALIAETRFVAPRPWGRVAVMVTYHLALAGLVVSLV
jgi:uncharacterized membrane protein YhhN